MGEKPRGEKTKGRPLEMRAGIMEKRKWREGRDYSVIVKDHEMSTKINLT